MALTVTRRSVESLGSKRAVIADVTFDASYPTGGEAIAAAADLGLSSLDFLQIEQNEAGVVVAYDRANGKLLVQSGALAEVADLSDQSGVSVRVFAIGD